MAMNPSGPMTYERAMELRDQCAADLAEARRQKHHGWTETLTWRLASLGRLVEAKRGRRAVGPAA